MMIFDVLFVPLGYDVHGLRSCRERRRLHLAVRVWPLPKTLLSEYPDHARLRIYPGGDAAYAHKTIPLASTACKHQSSIVKSR